MAINPSIAGPAEGVVGPGPNAGGVGGGVDIGITGNTSGTSSIFTTGSLYLGGGNNITLSQSSNTISIEGPNQSYLFGGSNITLSLSSNSVSIIGESGGGGGGGDIGITGNTTGTSSIFTSGTMYLGGGNNITLSQDSNTITISAPNITYLAAGTNITLSSSSNSISIIGAAGGAAGTNTLGISDVGNTSGTSGVISGTGLELVLAGGNNVTLSQSIDGVSATITVSVANQTEQTGGLYAGSNTFGTSSGTFDARTLSLIGSGAVQIAASDSGFIISAPAQSIQPLSAYVESQSFGTSSGTIGQNLSISGSGLVSVAVSNGGLVISATSAAQTNQTIGGYATGANTTAQSSSTTFDARSLSISGAGGVSVGMSTTGAGAPVIVISGATTAAQTNQQISAYAVSNTTLSTSRTMNASAFSVEGAGIVSVGISNGSIVVSASSAAQTDQQLSMYAVSNTTVNTSSTGNASALSFEGAGGVSVGISGGSVIISGAAAGGGTNLSAYAVSNTTLATSNTLAFSAFSVEGAGNVSVGISNGSLVISGATAAGNTQVSAYAVSNTTLSTSTPVVMSAFSIEGAGGVSVGASNGSIIASAPNQSYLIGGQAISLSSSSNSITIYDPVTLSQLEPLPMIGTAASSLGVSSIYFQHFNVPQPLQFCRIDRIMSLSINASTSGSSNHTGTRSNTWGYTESIGIFTQGTGTNSTNLYSLISQSWSAGITESVSITTTASNAVGVSGSGTFGFVGQIDTNGGVTSSTFVSNNNTTTSTATSRGLVNAMSNISGLVVANMPIGSTILSPGDYWLAVLASTAAGASGGTSTNLMSISNIVMTANTTDWKLMGQTATATNNTLACGNGAGNAQTAAIPASIAFNAISNNSNVSLYFNLMNVSL